MPEINSDESNLAETVRVNREYMNINMNANRIIRCAECGIAQPEEISGTFSGRWYCRSCYEDNFMTCPTCENVIRYDESYPTSDNGNVCSRCYDETVGCERCDNRVHESNSYAEDNEDGETVTLCGNCHGEEGSISYRSFVTGKQPEFIGGEGKIVKSPRCFSAEIECQFPSRTESVKLSRNMPNGIGVGSDGSIEGIGLEIRLRHMQMRRFEVV